MRVNRAGLQLLAEERIAEAKVLLDAGRWSGAYYLAGYAVECALKACIAKRTKAEDFPDKNFVNASWTHALPVLVSTAGLQAEWAADCGANADLASHWLTVKDWKESSRYALKTEAQARGLYDAITDPANGVLPWIKLRW
jgi:HEPN domain-containing protein